MTSKKRPKGPLGTGGRRAIICAAPVLAFGWLAAQAQPVFVPPVQYGDRVTTVEQASTNWVGSVAAPALQAPATGPETYPLQWGPVKFHPHLGYQIVYGDGILRGPDDPKTTWLSTISPGVFLELGKYWNFDFTASFDRYSNAEFNNSQNYFGALRGHIPTEDWLLDFGYVASLTDQPQVQTAVQTLQNAHLVTASGIYNYQTRLSLELSGTMDARLAQAFNDYYTFSTLEWLNYKATSKTALGLGVGGGYNIVKPGPDWTFEQFQGRIVWLPGEKLTIQLSGGVQFMQFNGTDATGTTNALSETKVTPIIAAAAAYRAFEHTSFSLSADHLVGNAYEEGQFAESTTFSAGVRQRFLEHFYLDVVPGYTMRDYKSTLQGGADGRKDDYFSVYAGVSTALFKRLNVSVFYLFSDNDSNDPNFAFDSTQVGLRLEYRY